jgi:hypothetical protein
VIASACESAASPGLIGITVREYRALEAGEDALLTAETWERMIEVFGWPRAFGGSSCG